MLSIIEECNSRHLESRIAGQFRVDHGTLMMNLLCITVAKFSMKCILFLED